MKALLEQGIRENFIANMNLYPEDYPIQTSAGQGVFWTDDSVGSLVTWVKNEFENSTKEDKQILTVDEWGMVCAQAMYDELGLEDGDDDEANETWSTLIEEVNRLIND